MINKQIKENCDQCSKEISHYEWGKNKGLCNDCVEVIN